MKQWVILNQKKPMKWARTYKEIFCTNDSYVDARARLNAWATANGETFNSDSYTFTAYKVNPYFDNLLVKEESPMLILLIISSVAFVGVASIYLLKKRKEVK